MDFACDNCIFRRAGGSKNKQWTHSPPLNMLFIYHIFCSVILMLCGLCAVIYM